MLWLESTIFFSKSGGEGRVRCVLAGGISRADAAVSVRRRCCLQSPSDIPARAILCSEGAGKQCTPVRLTPSAPVRVITFLADVICSMACIKVSLMMATPKKHHTSARAYTTARAHACRAPCSQRVSARPAHDRTPSARRCREGVWTLRFAHALVAAPLVFHTGVAERTGEEPLRE